MKKMRVPLPEQGSSEWMVLAKKIQAKHEADGAASVLDHLDWTTIKSNIAKASSLHEEAEMLRMQSAQRTIDRDALMEDLRTNIRSVRDALTAVHIKNMKNLADWGFNVIEAPAARRRTTSTSPTTSTKQEVKP